MTAGEFIRAGLGGLDSDTLARGTWVGLESRLVPGGQVLAQFGHTLPEEFDRQLALRPPPPASRGH